MSHGGAVNPGDTENGQEKTCLNQRVPVDWHRDDFGAAGLDHDMVAAAHTVEPPAVAAEDSDKGTAG